MKAILKNGPLDGEHQIMGDDNILFSTGFGGERVAYVRTDQIDPETGQRVFAWLQTAPGENDKNQRPYRR